VASQKRIFIAAAGALAATLALAACGSDDYGLTSAQSAAIGAAPAAAPAEQLAAGAVGDPAQEDDATGNEADAEEAAEPAAPKVKAKPVGKVTDKLIAKTVPKMGNVITDAKGWVLYRFDKDKAKPPTTNCVGDCAILWPPVLADDTLELSGIDADKVDTIERADGGLQITVGGWPVYRYIGDKKPGTWKGQNVGGVWFVIQKDGKKNLTCLPAISKPVPLPADPAAKKAKKSSEAAKKSDTQAPAEDAPAYDSSGGY
jgi:predicted lipoprotein with Yx(FWY)xxD motif